MALEAGLPGMLKWVLWGLVGLAACGGDKDSDGSGGQGGEGGSIAEGGGGGVVTTPPAIWILNERGAAQPGVDVVIHDASGAIVSQHQSDAEGKVDVARADGQLVSVVWIQAGKYQPTLEVSTVVDTAIEDEVFFVVSPEGEQQQGGTQIETVLAPGMDGWDTLVTGSCWSNSMIGAGTYNYKNCPNADTFDIVVYFLPGQASWQVFPGLTVTPGMPHVLNVDKNLGQPVPRIPVIASDLPSDAYAVSGILIAHRPDGGTNSSSRSVYANESWFPELDVAQAYAPPGSLIEHRVEIDLGSGMHSHGITTWHEEVQSEMAIAPVPLADVLDVSIDPAGRVFGWSLGDGPRGDAVRLEIMFPPAGNGPESHDLRWTLHVPPTATEITLPQLPASFAEWMPAGAPNGVLATHVDAIGADGVAAASSARATGGDLQWIRLIENTTL